MLFGARAAAVAVVAVLAAGCSAPIEDVTALYEAAGGEAWCGTELSITLAPWIGNCGDPSGDGRVVLGISFGGDEMRASVDVARRNIEGEDAQLLLVPEDPDVEVGFQLRGRDRTKLEAAQEQLGGIILDSEDAIDAWLDGS